MLPTPTGSNDGNAVHETPRDEDGTPRDEDGFVLTPFFITIGQLLSIVSEPPNLDRSLHVLLRMLEQIPNETQDKFEVFLRCVMSTVWKPHAHRVNNFTYKLTPEFEQILRGTRQAGNAAAAQFPPEILALHLYTECQHDAHAGPPDSPRIDAGPPDMSPVNHDDMAEITIGMLLTWRRHRLEQHSPPKPKMDLTMHTLLQVVGAVSKQYNGTKGRDIVLECVMPTIYDVDGRRYKLAPKFEHILRSTHQSGSALASNFEPAILAGRLWTELAPVD